MKLARRTFFQLAAGACCLPALSRMTTAQAYPTRPIKLIVAFPAGGPADTMGRMVGQAVSAKIGQPVVVENVGGAGSTIALRMMTNANPDGYTLLVNSGGPFCTASQLYKLDYDPLKALVPVGNFAADSAVLVTTRTLPIATLSEFIQYAKANPGMVCDLRSRQHALCHRQSAQHGNQRRYALAGPARHGGKARHRPEARLICRRRRGCRNRLPALDRERQARKN
jgi:tripartite-type tricarboxylate transporter receptor subunit TctC